MSRGRLSKSPVDESVGDPSKADGQSECTVEAGGVVFDVGAHPPDVLPSSPIVGFHKQGGGCWKQRVKGGAVKTKREINLNRQGTK